MKKLFLLDAFALIFRSYYAFIKNPRYNSKGLNTSAIFGFLNTLDEIIKKEQPTHLGIAFDLPVATFRKKMFPKYKAQRPPTPEDIIKSIPYIKDMIRGFNIPIFEYPGFEADDLIGTLAKKLASDKLQVFIMTPDKDYMQLIDTNIFMFKPRRRDKPNEIIGLKELKDNYNINTPDEFIDILALWGDASDNIPGVPGIGEKTAKKLIAKYKSIEEIYNNINKIKGKQKENLLEYKDALDLSKKLVTIDINVDIPYDLKKLEIQEPNIEALTKIFDELEFKNASQRILQSRAVKQQDQQTLFPTYTGQQKTVPEFKTIRDLQTDYILVDNLENREKLISQLLEAKEVCFDTETTNINPRVAELVGISFSIKEKQAFYVPFPSNKDESLKILDEFIPFFENSDILKIGQNIKYDLIVLKNYNIEVRGVLFDTMVAHYLLYPDQKHNLTHLAEAYLKYQMVPIEKLIGKKGKTQRNMRHIAIDRVKDYACEDADITFQIKNILTKELALQQLENLFFEIEMPLINVLTEMEYNGVNLDATFLKEYSKDISLKIRDIEQSIYSISKRQFNIDSPKQLGDILFNKLNIDSNPKLTKTKQYSTAEAVLQKLKDKHEIIPFILEYRSLKTLLGTFIDALPKIVNEKTGRIHTSFNQAIASTGRLSSNNPNLQNIPIRTAEGRKIRKAFIPTTDKHIFIDADYSQIELRLMAHLSQDENMLEAFRNKEDIHTATASKIFKVPKGEVTKEMRYQAKTANFSIIYGASAQGIAQSLEIPRSEAKTLIDGYFETYPKAKEYIKNSVTKARETEFVTTIKNRKRYLSQINSQNGLLRSYAERNAVNAPIQGSAADIIKIAMINIHKKFIENKLESTMLIQVHDELLFNVLITEEELVTKIIKTEMENAIELSIPLTVDISSGKNWEEVH